MSNQTKPLQAIVRKEMEAMLAHLKGNRRSPIRNPKNNPATVELSHSGSSPMPLCMDLGVKREPRQRQLTAEECNEIFGVSKAVKMNFIPQMISALIMDAALELVGYCRQNKIKELRRHTKVIEIAVTERTEKLREAYGFAFEYYTRCVDRFIAVIRQDLMFMEWHADTLCKNQVPDGKHYPIFIKLLVIVMLIQFCDRFDAEMDKLIESKLQQPVKSANDVYRNAIHAACLSIAEDFGYKVNPDKFMGEWVSVLHNKAFRLADEIIGEEGVN